MKSYQQFLNEMSKKDKESCIDKFGKFLFGEFEKRGEKDTKLEKMTFRELVKFINGDSIAIPKSKNLKKALDELVKCKDMEQYKYILDPKKGQYIYRGTIIDWEDKNLTKKLKQNVNKSKSARRRISGGKIEYKIITKIDYKPHSPIQSWSTSKEVAMGFLPYEDPVTFLYKYKVNDKDFLFNPKWMNKLSGEIINNTEYEVIRISDKPISNIDVELSFTKEDNIFDLYNFEEEWNLF